MNPTPLKLQQPCELSVRWSLSWIVLVCHIWNMFVCISIVIMSHKVPRKSERACGFRKGHPAYVSKKKDCNEEQTGESLARWMPRLTQAAFARVTQVTPAGLIEIPDAEGHSGEAKMLRPRRDDHDDDDLTSTYLRGEDTREEMRLYDKGQMERMYNECIEQHSVTERGECVTPRCSKLPEKLKWDCVGSVVYGA